MPVETLKEKIQRIIELQGWNDESIVGLFHEFVEEQGLEEDLIKFLADKADDENEGTF